MISIEEYNKVVDENNKLKKLNDGNQYLIDQLSNDVNRFIQIKDIYKDQIDIAIKSDARQSLKVASINAMLHDFKAFLKIAIYKKIQSVLKDKISDDQIKTIIKSLDATLDAKTSEVVGDRCLKEEPDKKCYQILNFIDRNDYFAIMQEKDDQINNLQKQLTDYFAIMQEKDDQINNLQKQLTELQHKIITMTEEINEMFE